jgi:acetyl-CoA carboxylase biotin carboxyl carrier protein
MSKEQNKQSMTSKEIQDLMRLVTKLELSEFKMKDGDFQLSIRSKHFEQGQAQNVPSPQMVPVHSAPLPTPPAQTDLQVSPAQKSSEVAAPVKGEQAADSAADKGKYIEVKSPIVGTFYRSPSPDKPVYIKVGDTIEIGSVVCIVEAMKLFNEIESEVAGKVVKVMVEDASPVEYDQVLFLVEPIG